MSTTYWRSYDPQGKDCTKYVNLFKYIDNKLGKGKN